MNEEDFQDISMKEDNLNKEKRSPEKSGFSPRAKSNLKRAVGTSMIIGALGATAFVADKYDALQKAEDLFHTSTDGITETVSGAYEWTIKGIMKIGSNQNRINIANEIFKDIPADGQKSVIADLYLQMDRNQRLEFFKGSMAGKYGAMGDAMRSAAVEEILSSRPDQLARITIKGYEKLPPDVKEDMRTRIIDSLKPEKRAGYAMQAYKGLNETAQKTFSSDIFKAMDKDRKYSTALENILGMPNGEIKRLYLDGSKNFSGKDYVDTVVMLSQISARKYNNEPEIAAAVVKQSVEKIADKMKEYIQKHFN